MRLPENTDPQPYVRFKDRKDVSAALSSIQDCLDSINEDFHAQPSFGGSAVFSLDKSNPNLAGAIATADAPGIEPDRRWFLENQIKDRFVVIGSTTLKEALKAGKPTYLQSKMNPEEHFVYTVPLSDEHETIGALQYAIDYNEHSFLGDQDLDKIRLSQEEKIRSITKKLSWLYNETPSLPRSLALKDSNTPNSFIVRLDVHNSTHFINNEDNSADFQDYIDVLKSSVVALVSSDELLARFKTRVTDQGDGLNLIFDFPEYLIDRAAEKDLVNYILHTQISSIVTEIKQRHENINAGFSFKPRLAIKEGTAFVRFDSLGDPTAKEFWDLASQTKK